MSWKLRAAISALLLAPQAAFSLGLGDIRLSSALNEPLSAEIDLVAPTNEELGSLSAQLASRELFQRYGLDRPAYLDSMQFSLGRGRDGRNVLLVNSAAPISEPFVTFLVEVTWPRGRLLREYTVLLDPPVFAPKEAAPAAPVAAPRIAAPAPAPAPARAPAQAEPRAEAAMPRPVAPAAELPPTYRVQTGDTLYRLASRYAPGSATAANRMMIAMFRANPEAFGGNINILRAGAILRVPGPEAVAEISAGEAASEIGRQTAAWRGAETAREPERLRLVTPTEAAPGAVTPAPAEADLQSQIADLSRQIEDSKRLLELNNAKLARLQQQAAEAAAQQAAPEAPPAAAPEAPVAQPPAAPEAEKPAVAEAPAKPTPAPAPAAAPAPAKKPAKPAVSEPSFLDNLTANWQYVLGAAVLAIGGLLAFGYARRRREQDLGETIRGFELPAVALPTPPEPTRPRAPAPSAVVGTATEEQELEDFRTSTIPPSGRSAQDYGAAVEARPQAAAPIDLEQGDPLAEADFHMAYGLYDQAADIVKLALDKEPERRDYKMKLLEIYFVASDKQNFVAAARDFAESRAGGDGADWERVLIMGRQLAPEDALFEKVAPSSGVDLNLEGGDSRVDLELLAPPAGDESIDLDLGEALGAADSEADTGEAEPLDFDLETTGLGDSPTAELPRLSLPDSTGEIPRLDRTAEMPATDRTAEMPATDRTAEMPRLDTTAEMRRGTERTARMEPLPESTAEMPTLEIEAGQSPTVETTRLQPPPSPLEVTAEMPMDDLGIDLGDFDQLDGSRPEDDVTQIAPEVEETRRLQASSSTSRFDLSDLAPDGEDDTQRLRMDFSRPMREPAREPETDYAPTEEIPGDQLPSMSELEPVTMSEVGTKLDLARAYLDMGDPDGARSILEEVIKEGSASQKQEARRLLDSLPGA
jgi:pilus assembly protein FimV